MGMESLAKAIDVRLNPASRLLNAVGALTGLLMVVLVTVHVLSRAVFGKPLVGTVELEELMLVILVFCGMAHTKVTGNHISVDFVTMYLPEKTRGILSIVTSLICTCLLFALSWESIELSLVYLKDGMATFQLKMPLFWVLWIIALGFFLFGVSTFRDLVQSLAAAAKNGQTATATVAVLLGCTFSAVPFITNALGFEPELRTAQYFSIFGLILFLFSGMMIGTALAFVGYLGMGMLFGTGSGLGLFKTVPYAMTASYALCVIPFFVLMGEFCFQAGLSQKLYQAAYRWVGRFRGGLSMATVLGCGAFAAVSGSSLATTATMGAVALPEMKRYKYADTLATGCIAAGGTIGILIPPSIVMIIYGILTETSIAELFFAGVIPGLISLLYYIIAIVVWTRINPKVGPSGPHTPFPEKIKSLKDTWEVLCLFLLIMGGIYGGLFTPTEAGAIGATGALAFGLIRRKIKRNNLYEALLATGRTTSMVFLVVIGTAIYGYFLTSTQLPMELATYVTELRVAPVMILSAIMAICFGLGCIMGTLPLVFITVPIFAPVVQTLGYDLIWFGVIVVVIAEIGMITPPVGITVYIMKGIAGDVPLTTVFRGIFPFLIADVARLATLIAFPWLSLALPQLLR